MSRHKMNASTCRCWKLVKKLSRSEAERKALKEELALVRATSSIMVAGRLRKQMAKLTGRATPHGGYAMALMRNTAHVGTRGSVKMLELPVSRQTVEKVGEIVCHQPSHSVAVVLRFCGDYSHRRSRGSTLS